ncbi:MAG TPA: hypothetical protein VMW16_15070 [Sedimentisphaerales bacterium]|nr:hypothetical protein [Sedimentisphaerales bacterium]
MPPFPVDDLNGFVRRVPIQFAEPLPFKPGEQADGEADAQQQPESARIQPTKA